MTHPPAPQFLVFEEGIINIFDISTITPHSEPRRRPEPPKEGTMFISGPPVAGVRVMFRSQGKHLFLPGQTIRGIESRLNGTAF